MAKLYANENFPSAVVRGLLALGHDVITTHDVGKSRQGLEDEAVLDFAIESDRCVITLNRRDFIRLHRLAPNHKGIIVCSENQDFVGFARRIDEAILQAGNLENSLIRVFRGS
jgi:hypothetical protein